MKKLLFILILTAVSVGLYAQTPRAKQKAKTPALKVDTIKKQDNMPVIKPKDNSPMPIATPQDNARMPILNPDSINKNGNKGKQAPKPQK
jgi:hypothetical protein